MGDVQSDGLQRCLAAKQAISLVVSSSIYKKIEPAKVQVDRGEETQVKPTKFSFSVGPLLLFQSNFFAKASAFGW